MHDGFSDKNTGKGSTNVKESNECVLNEAP